MKQTIGVCLSAGYDLDDLIDRYSWEQIGLIAEMILRDRFGTIEMLLSPLIGAAGGDYTAPSVKSTAKRSKTKGNHKIHRAADYSPEDRDKALMGALQGAGFRVRPSSSGGENGEAG